MSERYYMTGVQLGIIMSCLERGDLVAVVKTLNEIADKQFVGNLTEPSNEELAIVPKLKVELDVGR